MVLEFGGLDTFRFFLAVAWFERLSVWQSGTDFNLVAETHAMLVVLRRIEIAIILKSLLLCSDCAL